MCFSEARDDRNIKNIAFSISTTALSEMSVEFLYKMLKRKTKKHFTDFVDLGCQGRRQLFKVVLWSYAVKFWNEVVVPSKLKCSANFAK